MVRALRHPSKGGCASGSDSEVTSGRQPGFVIFVEDIRRMTSSLANYKLNCRVWSNATKIANKESARSIHSPSHCHFQRKIECRILLSRMTKTSCALQNCTSGKLSKLSNDLERIRFNSTHESRKIASETEREYDQME